VLSDSTEKYDRGDKFGFYRNIDSLQYYILINHKKPKIEIFTKQGKGWFFTETTENVSTVNLEAIECTLCLDEVYYDVSLDEPAFDTPTESPTE
jgi:Uma2 family endonuclease